MSDKVNNDGQGDVVDLPTSEEDVRDVETVEAKEIEQPEEVIEDTFEIGEEGEVAEPQDKVEQSQEENAQFKKMRLRAEEEAKMKLSKEKAELEALKLSIEQQKSEKKVIDEYLTTENIYKLADEEGISEEHAKKLLQYEAEKIIATEKRQIKEKFEEQQKIKSELKKDKYFHLLEGEVDELMNLNPDADYEALYYYQRGKKSDDLEKELANSVEKRTIANMHDRAKRKNVGGSSSTAPSTGLSDFGKEFADFMGVDPREAASVIKDRNKKRRN